VEHSAPFFLSGFFWLQNFNFKLAKNYDKPKSLKQIYTDNHNGLDSPTGINLPN
jgi:hypothetical protein